jgi:mRNA interferase MazF
MKAPKRGDIIICDLSPSVGREQSGSRPLVVLSGVEFNAPTGILIACPITSKEKGYFFEVKIKSKKTKGVALSHQVRTIDWIGGKVRVADRADESVLEEIVEKFNILVGKQR